MSPGNLATLVSNQSKRHIKILQVVVLASPVTTPKSINTEQQCGGTQMSGSHDIDRKGRVK